MLLNLESRLAQRVLIEVGEGPYRDENDLYQLAQGVAWSDWITPRQTLRVDTTAQRSPLKSLNFAALRVKDAVCDQMRDEHRRAAERRHRRPDLQLVLHLGAERAALYVDSSGESLFKRGWREDKGEAPLKETLAAAMLAAAGWRGTPAKAERSTTRAAARERSRSRRRRSRWAMAPGRLRRFAFERHVPFANAEQRAELQRLRSRRRRASTRRRCRSSPATCRSGWSTSRAATPRAPASPTRSSSTAATRSSARRRRCRQSCPAR